MGSTTNIETRLLHGVNHTNQAADETYQGATLPPVFATSAFAQTSALDMEKVFANQKPGFVYSRLANPTVAEFERRMAAVEGGFAATAVSSGSAAVADVLLTILRAGDEIIVPSGIYGGTIDFFRDLTAFGVKTIYVDEFTPENIEPQITDRTKALFAELISNPKLSVVSVKALSALAKEHRLPLIIDSTTATPALCNPLSLGADVVVHSSSKYINGNSDAISGVIIDGGTFDWRDEKYGVLGDYQKNGKFAFTARLRNTIYRDIGTCLSPFHAFLNLLGIETLSLRMERISENALSLAKFLQTVEGIKDVTYPGLPDHPQNDLINEQLRNGYAGGILTFRVGSKERAFDIIDGLKIVKTVSNIGDTKTLIVHPHSTIFAHSSEDEKQAAGVYEDLIRVSVGIENIEDLTEDFKQALGAA